MAPFVKFGELGTFDREGDTRHIGHLPNSPQEIGTKFWYQFKNSKVHRLVAEDPKSLEVVKNGSLVFIVHGYQSSAHDSLIISVKNGLLKNSFTSGTVIVDWEGGAASYNYFQAAANTELVGRQTALLLDRLRKKKIDMKSVHLIGFSLGSQVCGFAGRWTQRKYKFKVGRISVLDAAWYLFEGYSIHVRKGDAIFVDAIHTSAGNSLMRKEFGTIRAFGDIDFFPNGGTKQPHCWNSTDPMCNHLAALIFYQTSISYSITCDYLAVKCNSYEDYLKKKCDVNSVSRMGLYASEFKATGKHYLQTTMKYPHKSPIPSDKQRFGTTIGPIEELTETDSLKDVTAAEIKNGNDAMIAIETKNGNEAMIAVETKFGKEAMTAAETKNDKEEMTAAETKNGKEAMTAAETKNGNEATIAVKTKKGNRRKPKNGIETTVASETKDSNGSNTSTEATNGVETTTATTEDTASELTKSEPKTEL
ncbi:Ves m 1-like allergen [Leptotrombidium deliense]|uniref:Ves m 1-like allergen n=1 Tax=Leptotrombidium deliense TaxID=299467 RepID=A0A443SEK5_9ACAR|nr:Ves m 1-like allergen [Leptotrombidium deliense]